jgi:hypothetical protein
MIVPAMNSIEIVKEIAIDKPMVNRKGVYLTESLRRNALKSKTKYVQKIFDYKSQRNNKWIIIANYYKKCPNFSTIAYYVDHFGLHGISIDPTQPLVRHYTSHFLTRYNQRFVKQANISKLDLLKRFCANNSAISLLQFEDNDEVEDGFFARSREGVSLGIVERIECPFTEIFHFKTFISSDMIFESQKNEFNIADEQYKTYWEETFKYTKKGAFD